MTPAVAADVGNTRIKWGRCVDGMIAEAATLAHDDPKGWRRQCDAWSIPAGAAWALSGVQPAQRGRLREWLASQKYAVRELDSNRELPIEIAVDFPEKVGIDRLLNGVAALSRRPKNRNAIVVDAGSAVTVDWIDDRGRFRGGAIFPGMRLMADALHRKTALLPLATVERSCDPPGASTIPAIQAGIFHAVLGGIESLVRALRKRSGETGILFLCGGDAPVLAPSLSSAAVVWPEMTLEGIRLAALALPEPH